MRRLQTPSFLADYLTEITPERVPVIRLRDATLSTISRELSKEKIDVVADKLRKAGTLPVSDENKEKIKKAQEIIQSLPKLIRHVLRDELDFVNDSRRRARQPTTSIREDFLMIAWLFERAQNHK